MSEVPLHRATIASSSVSAFTRATSLWEDDDIFGDGVNVAARLEGLAEPGGICVSARVQEDVAERLDLTFDKFKRLNTAVMSV
jgi:class 3 adenylate cyclase